MKNIDEIIQFETECTSVEFKQIQYVKDPKSGYEEFLRDVIALANADTEDRRIIICGVKGKPNGKNTIHGIPENEIIDAATYQQIVRENVEPAIDLLYTPHSVAGVTVGILELRNCDNQFYSLKKQYKGLSVGDGWIRRGTSKSRIRRSDHDDLLARKLSLQEVSPEQITFSFDGASVRTQIDLLRTEILLPSLKARARLEAAIAAKKSASFRDFNKPVSVRFDFADVVGLHRAAMTASAEKELSLDELEAKLQSVDKDYSINDLHYLFEKQATRVQVFVTNNGDYYLDDVTVEMLIPPIEGLLVSDRIHDEPRTEGLLNVNTLLPRNPVVESERYPFVKSTEKGTLIRQHCGAIKHHRVTAVFDRMLRIIAAPTAPLISVPLEVKLLAKNLRNPQRFVLTANLTDRP